MRCRSVLAVLVLVAGGVAPAAAQPRHESGRERGARPLDELLPHVRSAHPGTFYDAQGPFRGPDGRLHYRLKWLTPSGRMIWLDTDAATGRVLGVSRAAPPPPPQPQQYRRFVPRGRPFGREFRPQRPPPPPERGARGRRDDRRPHSFYNFLHHHRR